MEKELLSHYRKDAEGKYLLEFKIKDIDDFYDSFDPSPLQERDLNPSIVNKVLEEIIIFPAESQVSFMFHLPKRWKRQEIEQRLEKAIRHTFKYHYLGANVHMHRRIKKGKKIFISAFIIFLLLISLAKFLEESMAHSFILNVLNEGLYICGWVSLWKPVEILLYDWLPLKEEKKRFARLLDFDIKFDYY